VRGDPAKAQAPAPHVHRNCIRRALARREPMPSASDLANLLVAGLASGLLLALPAVAMTLIFGVSRFPNAAVGDLLTFGAYAALVAETVLGRGLVASGAVALVATAFASLASYFLVFRAIARRSTLGALIASIGVAFVLRSAVAIAFGHDQRTFELPITRALRFGELRILPADLWLAGLALAILVLVFAMLRFTDIGKRMRAVADNATLARASGIRADRVLTVLWLVAGAICGIAGVLLGMRTVIAPEMGADFLLPIFAAMVLGGIGSPAGAVLGALAIGVIEELATPFVGSSYKTATGFVITLAVLLARPQGLFGRVEAVR
jgi:branched-chain amino acid transport system permease protein